MRAVLATAALALALLAGSLLAAPAAGGAGDLTVVALDGKTTTFTAADLADLPRGEAMLHEGAKAAAYQGPTLTSILRQAGVPVGPRAHGAPMKAYVVVRGQDGYAATLSLAETDPEFRTGPIVLADTLAGVPLDAKQGPYRLVIGDDLKPWRAVKHVVRIEVRSAP